MSSEVIGSNEEAASQSSIQLQQGLVDYCDLRLTALCSSVPVTGSLEHDNLAPSVADAMQAWQSLLEKDASDIIAASATFLEVDKGLVQNMMGLGAD